jgi:dolichyl-phosphate-mannose--protein O-mannosyl transferase
MTISHIFLERFWPLFIGTTVVFVVVSCGRRFSLSGFRRNDSSLLVLAENDLSHTPSPVRNDSVWLCFVGAILQSAAMSASIALVMALVKAGMFPNSLAIQLLSGLILSAIGWWLVRQILRFVFGRGWKQEQR